MSVNMTDVIGDLAGLADECVAKAREAVDVGSVVNEDHALAAKNWSAAALSATQAWMTVVRGREELHGRRR
jgi:hypothetical protein